MSEPEQPEEVQETPPHLTNVEAAVVHLKEGDILVCSISEPMIEQVGYQLLADQVRRLIGNTGRKNVGFVIVPAGDVTFDVIKNDREMGRMRMELDELKAEVEKIIKAR